MMVFFANFVLLSLTLLLPINPTSTLDASINQYDAGAVDFEKVIFLAAKDTVRELLQKATLQVIGMHSLGNDDPDEDPTYEINLLQPMDEGCLHHDSHLDWHLLKNRPDYMQIAAISDKLSLVKKASGDQEQLVVDIKDATRHAVRETNGSQIELMGDMAFVSLGATEAFYSNHHNVTSSLIERNHEEEGVLIASNRRLLRLDHRLNKLVRKLNLAYSTRENTTFTGKVTLSGPLFVDALGAESLDIVSIDGKDLTEVIGSLPHFAPSLLDGEGRSYINGEATFERNLTVNHNLTSAACCDSFNGLRSRNFVTTNQRKPIDTPLHFQNLTADNMSVTSINDMAFDDIAFIGGVEPVLVETQVAFDEIHVEKLDVEVSLDSFQLNGSYLLDNEDQTVTGLLVIANNLTTDHLKVNRINTFPVKDFEDIVRVDVKSSLNEKTFSGDLSLPEVTIRGHLNQVRFPEELMLTNVSQVIKGENSFRNTTFEEKITVEGLFDGLNLPEDVVTLDSEDKVLEVSFVEGFKAEGDVSLTEGSLVDGIDLKEMTRDSERVKLELKFREDLKRGIARGPVVVSGNILTNGNSVNEVNVEEVAEDAINSTDLIQAVMIGGKKILNDEVTATLCSFGGINGSKLSDYVLTNESQIIESKVVFDSPLELREVVLSASSSDLGFLIPFLEYVNFGKNGTSFEADLIQVLADMVVKGKLNELLADDLVTRSTDQSIGNAEFGGEVVAQLLKAASLITDFRLDDVDISNLRNRITLDGAQPINDDLTFGNLTVHNMTVETTNKFAFDTFVRNVMTLSGDQELSSNHKYFKGSSHFYGDISSRNSFVSEAIKLSDSHEISQHFEFKDGLDIVGDVNADTVNGLNLDIISSNSVHKATIDSKIRAVLSPTNRFEGGLTIKGSLNVGSLRFNDMYRRHDVFANNEWHVLLKHKHQDIDGFLNFRDLTINGDVDVESDYVPIARLPPPPPSPLIDDQVHSETPLTDVNRNCMSINDFKWNDDVAFILNTAFLKGMDIQKVNGISWSKLLEDIVTTRAASATSVGHKAFLGNTKTTGSLHSNELTIEGQVNNISLDAVNSMAINEMTENVYDKKSFVDDVHIDSAQFDRFDVLHEPEPEPEPEYYRENRGLPAPLRIIADSLDLNNANVEAVNGEANYVHNLVLLNEPQTQIKGWLDFEGDISFKEKLDIQGRIVGGPFDDIVTAPEEPEPEGGQVVSALNTMDRLLDLVLNIPQESLLSGEVVLLWDQKLSSYSADSYNSGADTTVLLSMSDEDSCFSTISVRLLLDEKRLDRFTLRGSFREKSLLFLRESNRKLRLLQSPSSLRCSLRVSDSDSVAFMTTINGNESHTLDRINEPDIIFKDISMMDISDQLFAVAVTPKGVAELFAISSKGVQQLIHLDVVAGNSVKSLRDGDKWHVIVASKKETKAFIFEGQIDMRFNQLLPFPADILDVFNHKERLGLIAVYEKNAVHYVNLFYWKKSIQRWVEWQSWSSLTPVTSLQTIEFRNTMYLIVLKENKLSIFLLGSNGFFEKLFNNFLGECGVTRHVHGFVADEELYLIVSGSSTKAYKTLLESDRCQRYV